MSNIAIQVKNLHKSYNGIKAVDNLHFHVNKMECFGILGPNGAGKTTTMKILYGKTENDQNKDTEINIFGYNPDHQSLAIKAFSGIIPQQDNLDTELNVTDNLLIYSKFYGIPSTEAKKRISELLGFMELQEKARVKIKELSGGMQRRLTIARALLNKPKLLLLDEPTTGLDPQVRHLIWNRLRELKDTGVTIILTTHYMEEAFNLCDRIIIMDNGRKMIEGNPANLLAENLESYVMEVFGAGKNRSALKNYFAQNEIKCEFQNDTLLAFSNNEDKLTEFATIFKDFEYHIRRSNLEDLFLKVTGRSLNESQ
ncbi:MAG: ATP-binding cassette domain-containing protein [Acidobacteria bacterium]|jgi:lipooligosaccharide transport system ATP-binding protein|nr:ATP-binding cassette domain-containing protein [Acidobacteriota bacterium]